MTKSYWGRLWGLAFFMSSLLLGYALASPVRLSIYFFPKPAPDLVIDVVLIGLVTFLSFRWMKGKGSWLILTIPFLALSWLRLDFILFSKSDWWSIISYVYIAWWGMSFAALWKHFEPKGVIRDKLFTLGLGLLFGFAWGYTDDHYLMSYILACLFIAAIPYAGINPNTGQRLLSEKPAILLFLSPLLVLTVVETPTFFKSQKNFHDKVVFSIETRFQRLDVTEWKGNLWFYQQGVNQFSAIDSWLYFEPFAHPAMQLVPNDARVLIVGGENGMLANTLLAYQPDQIDLLPIDREYLELASEHPLYAAEHEEVFENSALHIINEEAFYWLQDAKDEYDVIFIDVPDPVDIELNQYFTREFYGLCRQALKEEGVIVTQSGSPYFATAAFRSIQETMLAADFSVTSYHNQVLTLGEWGWTIGSKQQLDLDSVLKSQTFEGVATQWLNQEAMRMMLSFGKPYVAVDEVRVNTIKNPVIHRYYNRGNYQLN